MCKCVRRQRRPSPVNSNAHKLFCRHMNRQQNAVNAYTNATERDRANETHGNQSKNNSNKNSTANLRINLRVIEMMKNQKVDWRGAFKGMRRETNAKHNESHSNQFGYCCRCRRCRCRRCRCCHFFFFFFLILFANLAMAFWLQL